MWQATRVYNLQGHKSNRSEFEQLAKIARKWVSKAVLDVFVTLN